MQIRRLIKDWFRIGHTISWRLSFETLIGLLYFIPGFQNDRVYSHVLKKHEIVLSFLGERYSDILDKYRDREEGAREPHKRYIWVFWAQGEEKAPPLVKMCIKSIGDNSGTAELVILDLNNYMDWVDIPEYIVDKFKKGMISVQHFADILRVFLIARHGGLWLDATIYVSGMIPDDIFKMNFYSLHTDLRKTPYVQNDRVHLFVFGGRPHSNIAEFEKEILSRYLGDFSVIMDYYLLDYTIMFQYLNIERAREDIDALPLRGEGMYELESMLDDDYDDERVKAVLSRNTFSKLSWNKKRRAGDTVFSHLLRLSERM